MGRLLDRLFGDVPGKRTLAAGFLLHVVVTAWCAFHHEAWRDEVNPWLIARDGGLAEILGGASHRGTPALWDLLLWPLAASGAPFASQQILNLLLVWAATLLLFRSAAFPPIVKALFALSYYPAFEYPVVARNYGLLLFFLFLAASQWKRRNEQPLLLALSVFLLASTAMHGLVIAAVIGLLLTLEWVTGGWISNRPQQIAMGVMLVGGLAAVAQLWPQPGGQVLVNIADLDTVWFALSGALFPSLRAETGLVPAVLVLSLIGWAIGRAKVSLLFLLQTVALLLALFVFVWMGGLRHAGLILLVTVAAVWLADSYGPLRRERLAMAGLAVALLWSIVPAARAWRDETRYAYSGAKGVAEFILEAGRADVPLVTIGPFRNATLAWLPGKKFWYAAAGEYGSYTGFDLESQRLLQVGLAEAVGAAEAKFEGTEWFLLLDRELPESKRRRFRLVYRTPGPVWGQPDERFWLYEPVR